MERLEVRNKGLQQVQYTLNDLNFDNLCTFLIDETESLISDGNKLSS